MANQSFHIDDKTFQAADVKGQLMIWQDGDQRLVRMPDGFTLDEAEQKIVQILDELNTQPAES